MKKILVVDDDEDILILLKSYFTINGYAVKTTTTCDEGLEIFYNFNPHLVLLDVNVGNVDGRIMCKTIKSQAAHQHIPVILMSANPDMLVPFAAFGAATVMEKPFNLSQLLLKVQSYTSP